MKTSPVLSEFLKLAPLGDLWVFGYGSLTWLPGFRSSQKSVGQVHGYHRSLCVYSDRYRGTEKRPGLVMGLCRGGSCWGMVYRVSSAQATRVLAYLWRREMFNHVYQPRFLRVRIRGGGKVRALAFVADTAHQLFIGDLDVEHTARLVAQAHGERGRNIDYLSNTLAHMHEVGVRDPHLDRVLLRALALRGARRALQSKKRGNLKR
ncbi:MAG TPA: gamma-glutamylcyclotransferase [Burkholderiales bacterium]|nr:gamma-glutamylcyclotransferase [Burkholderiales bacterium]